MLKLTQSAWKPLNKTKASRIPINLDTKRRDTFRTKIKIPKKILHRFTFGAIINMVQTNIYTYTLTTPIQLIKGRRGVCLLCVRLAEKNVCVVCFYVLLCLLMDQGRRWAAERNDHFSSFRLFTRRWIINSRRRRHNKRHIKEAFCV